MKEAVDMAWDFAKAKIMLFIGMLIAASTAAVAIDLSVKLATGQFLGFGEAMGLFLGVRVILFMANPSMPLNDSNVQFMSEQRILWNLATIAVCLVVLAAKYLIMM